MTSISKPPLEGIGGWLALLAFAQVMGILRLMMVLYQNLQAYGPVADMPGGHIAIFAETAMNLSLIALAMATAFALFQKKRVFKTLFLYQWISIPVVAILDIIVVAVAMGVPVDTLDGALDGKAIGGFIAPGIWVWYIFKSKRVANTMVN